MAFFHSNFLLQTPHHLENDTTHTSTSLPPIPPQEFHAGTAVASLMGKRPSFFPDMCDDMNGHCYEDELSNDGSQVGEKKRRLNLEQVKTLEKNFELGNKLEPERKMQLARALGLQPRQIAIWFQNRRARWKTKQLEKDYDALKRKFDAVKAENDSLLTQNHKLHAEIVALKNGEPTESINLNKETEGSSSNRSENTSEIVKLDISSCTDPPPAVAARGHHLFPASSSSSLRATNNNNNNNNNSTAALFRTGSSSRVDQGVREDNNNLCNMFVGMDDQTGFWPWLEQQHFN